VHDVTRTELSLFEPEIAPLSPNSAEHTLSVLGTGIAFLSRGEGPVMPTKTLFITVVALGFIGVGACASDSSSGTGDAHTTQDAASGFGGSAGGGGGLGTGGSSNAITEFYVSGTPLSIAAGRDGNLWFTEITTSGLCYVGRLTPDGALTEFAVPTTGPISGAGAGPNGIAAGPDGNLWFADIAGNNIDQISLVGALTEFPIPTASAQPSGIAAGSDGNLWFAELDGNNIGRITPSGTITEFPLPTAGSAPFSVVAGPDGNIWFTELDGNKIGRITPAGTITEFAIPAPNSWPTSIAAGPDGNLWFVEAAGSGQIGRITPTGTITEFPDRGTFVAIAAGPDGNLWVTDAFGTSIGRLTTGGMSTWFNVPHVGDGVVPEGNGQGITAGPDGKIWFTEGRNGTVDCIAP
jgi:streptogramin lyase